MIQYRKEVVRLKTLDLNLNFRSGTPLYTQIVEQVQGLILAGDLKPGDQLPTVRQLASELRINFNTVARCYRMLDEAGLISTQHGRGTYVLERPSPAQQEQLRSESLDGMLQDLLAQAARLRFTPEEVKQRMNAQLEHWKAGTQPADLEQ
jgi:GntR family transcriptional regulator